MADITSTRRRRVSRAVRRVRDAMRQEGHSDERAAAKRGTKHHASVGDEVDGRQPSCQAAPDVDRPYSFRE